MRFSLFRFTFPVFHNILILGPPHESRKPCFTGLSTKWDAQLTESNFQTHTGEGAPGLHAGVRRKEGPGQFNECTHLAGHPLILMIDNLAPGLHMEILDVKGGQAAGFNV